MVNAGAYDSDPNFDTNSWRVTHEPAATIKVLSPNRLVLESLYMRTWISGTETHSR